MAKEVQKDIRDEEWYLYFLEEAQAIIIEKKTIAAMELINAVWLLGHLILEKELDFKRAGYGEKKVELVAGDLGKSPNYIYKSIQLARKFKSLEEMWEKLPAGKSMTLYKLFKEVLPERNPEQKKKELEVQIEKQKSCRHFNLKIRCIDCGKEFEDDEYEFDFKEKNE